MLDLIKVIEPGTWRYIGQRVVGVDPQAIPVAGISLTEIHKHVGGTCMKVSRVDYRNAFVIERDPFRLLYVRPDYSAYRRTARMLFATCGWQVDFDHALGRHIAKQLGYKYVLLLRITPRVNRSHGRFERVALVGGKVPALCFADRRILDKWIGRTPTFMSPTRPRPYSPDNSGLHGLTLKQAGKWGFAMGVEDDAVPCPRLKPLSVTTSSVEPGLP